MKSNPTLAPQGKRPFLHRLSLALRYTCLAWMLTMVLARPVPAAEIKFGGYTWTVRSGEGGPGPNRWSERNVWLDAAGNLHLKLARDGTNWSCAEVTMTQRLGFGRYQFQTLGRVDQLDENVVLGLFNYPTGDVGPDGSHEIDIEYARWGRAANPPGNFTVWPVAVQLRQTTKGFPFTLRGEASTHRFLWRPESIRFQCLDGHHDDDAGELAAWNYQPPDPDRRIARKPMPVHLNLWLFQGRPPKNGAEVELTIRSFQFVPEPRAGNNGMPPNP